MKKRINIMIEEHDESLLEEISKSSGTSKSELIGVAINLLAGFDKEGISVVSQLLRIYDKTVLIDPFGESNNDKLKFASKISNITISL